MSTVDQTQGQGSFTIEQIRVLLTAIEDGETDVIEHLRPLQRIQDAKDLIRLGEQLLEETVADARAIPAEKKRVVLAEDGAMVLDVQRAADHSQHRYGWDVIGAILGITKQRAHKRFSR